ncbi:MAG TPA: hypothetical protein P5079_11815, partial [Elusimicrobiota bacterium]|nr:hypothetical protein [Elusimicrobiota bacterium]
RRNDAITGVVTGETGKGRLIVLVTGGFHTPGLTQKLREQGVSYAVVCPRVQKIEELNALEVFTRGHTPLDRVLLGEKIFLADPLTVGSRPMNAEQAETQTVQREMWGALEAVFGEPLDAINARLSAGRLSPLRKITETGERRMLGNLEIVSLLLHVDGSPEPLALKLAVRKGELEPGAAKMLDGLADDHVRLTSREGEESFSMGETTVEIWASRSGWATRFASEAFYRQVLDALLDILKKRLPVVASLDAGEPVELVQMLAGKTAEGLVAGTLPFAKVSGVLKGRFDEENIPEFLTDFASRAAKGLEDDLRKFGLGLPELFVGLLEIFLEPRKVQRLEPELEALRQELLAAFNADRSGTESERLGILLPALGIKSIDVQVYEGTELVEDGQRYLLSPLIVRSDGVAVFYINRALLETIQKQDGKKRAELVSALVEQKLVLQKYVRQNRPFEVARADARAISDAQKELLTVADQAVAALLQAKRGPEQALKDVLQSIELELNSDQEEGSPTREVLVLLKKHILAKGQLPTEAQMWKMMKGVAVRKNTPYDPFDLFVVYKAVLHGLVSPPKGLWDDPELRVAVLAQLVQTMGIPSAQLLKEEHLKLMEEKFYLQDMFEGHSYKELIQELLTRENLEKGVLPLRARFLDEQGNVRSEYAALNEEL